MKKTLKERVVKKLKKKPRRKAKGKEKLINKILTELIKDYTERGENKNLIGKKDLSISRLYRLIPKSQYGNVQRTVDDLEHTRKIIKSQYNKKGRIVELNPSWINPLKENYKINNGEINIFLISDNNNIRLLKKKSYIESLKSLYRFNKIDKIEFIFEEDIENLKNNNKLSEELGDRDMKLIHKFIANTIDGFNIELLDDDKINLIIEMWERRLLKRFDLVYNFN